MSAARVGWAVAVAEAALIAWLLLAGRTADPLGDGGPEQSATTSAVPVPATADAPPPAPTAPASAPAPVPPGAAGTPASPPAAPDPGLGVVLFGRVTDEAGSPLEAMVWLQADGGGRGSGRGPAYAIAGLAPGIWKLNVRATGFRDAEETLDLAAVGATHRHDVVLRPAVMLRVRFLTPDGGSLVQALAAKAAEAEEHFFETPLVAVATRAAPGPALALTPYRGHATSGVGRYHHGLEARVGRGPKIPEGVDGVLEVSERLPVHVSAVLRHLVLATQQVSPGASEVVFRIPLDAVLGAFGSARLRLVHAETKQPIREAQVELSDRQGTGGGAEIAEDGSVTWPMLVPGLLQLSVWAGDREQVNHTVLIRPGATTDLGTLALQKAATIAGVMVDPEGRPLDGTVTVHALDRLPFPQDLDVGTNWSVEASKVSISGAGRGRTLLRANVKDRASVAIVVDTAGGDVGDVRLVVPTGTPVTIQPQVPEAGAFVLLVATAAGTPVWSDYVDGPWPRTLRLAPGRYTCAVHDPDGTLRKSVPFEVGDAQVTLPVGG